MLYRSKEMRNLIAIFFKVFLRVMKLVRCQSFCDQIEKISQIKLTLCPTHEGMVEIASVLDFFQKA